MKKALIIPAVIVVLLVGCRPEENREQLKAVNRSLEYANEVMQQANNLVYEDFIEKKRELSTAVYVAVWEPKANQIRKYSDSIKSLIKTIKSKLVKQSDSLKKDYVDLTKQLYNADGVGGQLFDKLTAFKDNVPAVFYSGDTLGHLYWKRELNNLLKTVPLLIAYQDSLPAEQKSAFKKKWLKENFGRGTALMAMVMLNKIESDLLAAENAFIECCKNQIAIGCNLMYFKFSALAVLSSSYIKPGQSIQVSAGIGGFSAASKPTITINGKRVPLNEDAVAQYSFKPAGKPGKYSVPVTIDFIRPDGGKFSLSKNQEYIIAEKQF